jgi:hypothetical protein
MEDEFRSLTNNNTWTLVQRPSNHKVVKNKWVLKVKRKPDGSVDRYKARLVAKGFTQTHGIDYHDTFSPVVKINSFKAVLAVAGQEGLQLDHLNAKTAFLQGDLGEEIYMEQPKMFEQGEERAERHDLVCRLNKPIYGLKQSSRCWNKKLHAVLTGQGCKLTRSHADYCLYHLRRGDELRGRPDRGEQ